MSKICDGHLVVAGLVSDANLVVLKFQNIFIAVNMYFHNNTTQLGVVLVVLAKHIENVVLFNLS